MRNLRLIALLAALSACTTVEPQKQIAFHPAFSTADLEYVVTSLLQYIGDPKSHDEYSAKSLVKGQGGLLQKDINVILPDDSIVRIKVLSRKQILISGFESSSEPFLRISKNKKGYDILIGPAEGIGTYANFSISPRGGKVEDIGILMACP